MNRREERPRGERAAIPWEEWNSSRSWVGLLPALALACQLCSALRASATDWPIPLVSLTNVWRYYAAGSAPGASWMLPNYDDSAWAQGPGVLACETLTNIVPLIGTQLSLTNAAGEPVVTYYFRMHFQFTNQLNNPMLVFSNLLDDGAVFYLNGAEVFRFTMPPGLLTYGTLASGIQEAYVFEMAHVLATNLTAGDNVLAVELHQCVTNSSDVVLGVALLVRPADSGPPAILTPPASTQVRAGDTATLSVSAAGEPPLAFQWYKAGNAVDADARISGATASTLIISNLTVNDVGPYYVVISNAQGVVTSRDASLNLPIPDHAWLRRLPGSTGDTVPYGLASDTQGNLFVTGYFTRIARFGGISFTNVGSRSIFVAKFNRAGDPLWAQTAPATTSTGTNDNSGRRIAVDAQGNCFVTGWFSDEVAFGTNHLTSRGAHDIFVAKYDPNGQLLWVLQGGGSADDYGHEITAAPDGGCFVVWFGGSGSLGGLSVTVSGSGDAIFASISAAGVPLWLRRGGGNNYDCGYGIAADPFGNCFLTGWFKNTANFGGKTVTSVGNEDIFWAKYDSAGNALWVRRAGGANYDTGFSVCSDGQGNCYTVGWFSGDATFGTTTLHSRGGSDVFVSKHDPDGTLVWVTQLGRPTDDLGEGIAVDALGNVLVCGAAGGNTGHGTNVFGAGTLTSLGMDGFVAKLDASGCLLWFMTGGGEAYSDDQVRAIAVDGAANVYYAAYTAQGMSLWGTNSVLSSGSANFVLARLSETFVTSSFTLTPAYDASAGRLALEIAATPGSFVTIEAAPLLHPTSWTELTNIAMPSPTIHWFDPTPVNPQTQRFYRTRLVP
jgi:hypothetical protein